MVLLQIREVPVCEPGGVVAPPALDPALGVTGTDGATWGSQSLVD